MLVASRYKRIRDRLKQSLERAKLESSPAELWSRAVTPERLQLIRDRLTSRRAVLIFSLAVALALASYAQYAIGAGPPWFMSPFSRLDDELVRIYGRPQSVLLAFGLFVAAGVLFVVGTRTGDDGEMTGHLPAFDLAALRRGGKMAARWLALYRAALLEEGEMTGHWPASDVAALRRGVWTGVAAGMFVVGAGLWTFVVARLWSGHYEESYPLLFGLSLVGLIAPFVRWDLAEGLRIKFRFHWWEPLLVAALSGAFFALNVRDLDGWRYVYIGDEGAFFEVAQQVTEGSTWNLFSQAGAYGYHPLGTSAYQAMVMKVFGVDYFGWKMASLLAIVASIPVFYVLVRLAFGTRSAVFATVFLSASHYLFAYAHTGYNNIFALFPVVGAFVLFFAGWRYASSLALFGAGALSGLGFYSFFSARVGIVILALFILTMGVRWWRPAFVGPVALGFTFLVVPIFAVDKMEVIDAVLRSSATESADPLGKQLLENLPRALFAFNYNPHSGHYVGGSLMDAASAVLAVLGLSYSLFRIRRGSHRFLIIWFAVAVTATGVFYIQDIVPFTRMHVVVLVMAAFAGIAVDRILATVEGLAPAINLRPVTTGLALAVLLPLVFGLNIHRFWSESPSEDPTHHFTVAVRAVTEGPCAENGPQNVMVSEVWTQALGYVFGIYGSTEDLPTLLSYEEVLSGAALDKVAEAQCVVLLDMNGLPANILLAVLRTDKPTWQVEELTDLSGLTRLLVAHPP